VRLGKAVPPGREVPSLVYELAHASDQKHVNLASIVYGAGGSGSSATASQSSATVLAGFTQMPFTFVFNGTFGDLYNLFKQLSRFTVRTASGGLEVSGRLLTIQSAKLTPITAAPTGSAKGQELSGTITATAYVLPASQGLTGGATASSPANASSSSVSSTSSRASSPTAPAIARVTP
jgi:hypothetical protein